MNNNEITIIKRECNFLRYYTVNGKELESIVIYKDGEIILKTRSGWFEKVNENFSPSYCGDLLEIAINGPVKRANKMNLDRKDNYIFKWKENACIRQGVTLFIHADNIFTSYEELPKKWDEKKVHYLYGYKVNFIHPFKQYEIYLKYYNRGDELEDQDLRREIRNAVKRDENGKPMKGENGKYIIDEDRFFVSRIREITTKKEIILYNGLYIKEGK